MNRWTVVLTPHLDLWRRGIVTRVSREDDIPLVVDVVDFGSPEISGVIHSWWWAKDKLGLGIGPVGQGLASEECDVLVVGVGEIVVVFIAEHPWVCSSVNDWVRKSSWGC